MLRTITRRFGVPIACAALGAGFALACVYAADGSIGWPGVPNTTTSVQSPAGSTLMPLTTEQIDVLTEGEDYDHPWESCRINTDLQVTCPDGYVGVYPMPEPNVLDGTLPGGTVAPNGYLAVTDMPPCEGDGYPCRTPMDPTYVVGPDGIVHNECIIIEVADETSAMVCSDDTVWPS